MSHAVVLLNVLWTDVTTLTRLCTTTKEEPYYNIIPQHLTSTEKYSKVTQCLKKQTQNQHDHRHNQCTPLHLVNTLLSHLQADKCPATISHEPIPKHVYFFMFYTRAEFTRMSVSLNVSSLYKNIKRTPHNPA